MADGEREGATDGEGEEEDERADKNAGPAPTGSQEQPVKEVASLGKDTVLGDPEAQCRAEHHHS